MLFTVLFYTHSSTISAFCTDRSVISVITYLFFYDNRQLRKVNPNGFRRFLFNLAQELDTFLPLERRKHGNCADFKYFFQNISWNILIQSWDKSIVFHFFWRKRLWFTLKVPKFSLSLIYALIIGTIFIKKIK